MYKYVSSVYLNADVMRPPWRNNNKISNNYLNFIILVNNQLDALFQCMYLFRFSTCFEQPSAHHKENQLYQYIIGYISFSVDDVLVQLILLMMSTGLLETCREAK
jgi:hypothetical protein